jgi:hypothetical protein
MRRKSENNISAREGLNVDDVMMMMARCRVLIV